jgi:hypothetical protein
MKRGVMLGVAAVCMFVLVAAIMLKVMPAPLKESDYIVIGSVATLVALGVVFVTLISTTASRDVFFKKRKK